MKNFLLIFPVAALVAYSQIIVKIKAPVGALQGSIFERLFSYLTNYYILSAYLSALLASFAWLFVVTKMPLTVAFPAYIGITFLLVCFGGWFFLNEEFSAVRILAVLLVFAGVVLGVLTHA